MSKSRYLNPSWWWTLAFYFFTFMILLELDMPPGSIALGFLCVLLADVAVLRDAVKVVDHNTHVLRRTKVDIDGQAIADAVRRRSERDQ